MSRLVYVTDLHGQAWKFTRALALAKETGACAVINGGDLAPPGRSHEAQGTFYREVLDPHLAACRAAGIRFLAIRGNDDIAAHDALFEDTCAKHPGAAPLDGRRVEVGARDVIGMSWTTDFPFRLKDRARRDRADGVFRPTTASGVLSTPDGYREIADWRSYALSLPSIEDELAALPAPRDPSRAIYVLHGPPSGLGLDLVRGGASVGSEAVRRFLERRQPLLSLHGHIHESPEESGVWMATLGRTVCIQPGQFPPLGARDALVAVTIDLDARAFERIILPAP